MPKSNSYLLRFYSSNTKRTFEERPIYKSISLLHMDVKYETIEKLSILERKVSTRVQMNNVLNH